MQRSVRSRAGRVIAPVCLVLLGSLRPAAGANSGPAPTACDTAEGRVLAVGPDKAYAVPSAAAAEARPGDVIKIDAGDYVGDVATWSATDLTICGQGGRARLFADGKSAQGKAIWVFVGVNAVVDSIEFRDARVPDQNGAGIRVERGNLAVRNSAFFDNENGILSGGGPITVTIERSEFGRNGHGDGYSHNIYIGAIDRLVIAASFFHEAKVGHNLKSRARETRIENSYFMDGPLGTASYLADFPNGGVVYLRGNLFHKGPNANNSVAIAYGKEGLASGANSLEVVHNTVVMTRGGGSFLAAAAATPSVRLTANLFAGGGNPVLLDGGVSAAAVVMQDNVMLSSATLAGADRIAAPNFWPAAAVLPQVRLRHTADPGYLQDSPHPLALRAIGGTVRVAGALQSKP